MMFGLLMSVLICVVVTYMYRYWRRLRWERSLTAALPGWSSWPLLGNAHKFMGNTESFFSVVLEATEIAECHNGRFRAWMGTQFIISTSNPEDIRVVTNASIKKPYFYDFSRIWIGNGLVTAPVDVWRRNIKYLSGTFTGSIVDGFQDVFNSQSSKLMNQLRGEVGKPPFDALQRYFAFATLETICQTAFGVMDVSSTITSEDYYTAFNNAMEIMALRGCNILCHPEFIFKMTPGYWELKRNVQILHNVSNFVIAKKRKELDKNKINNSKQTDGNLFKTYLDILLALSESNPELTDEQIRAEVDTIIVGGQETNATTLSFALLLLGSHREVQDKLYTELKDIFGESRREVTKEDLSRMQYCEAVINETLRLYPPVPFVMRQADKDLEMDGYKILDGTVVLVSIWGVGRSKRLWGADADVFNPDRWLNKDTSPTPAAFIPFSYGRRACIGRKYAVALLKTLLAWCVRELEFRSDIRKLKLNSYITLRATQGNLITTQLRK